MDPTEGLNAAPSPLAAVSRPALCGSLRRVSLGLVTACGLAAWGCGPRLAQPRGAEAAIAELVAESRPELQEQALRGTGPQVLSLARTAGCQNLAALGRQLRREHSELFIAGETEASGRVSPAPEGGASQEAPSTQPSSAADGAAQQTKGQVANRHAASPSQSAAQRQAEAPPPSNQQVAQRITAMMKAHPKLRCIALEWGPGTVYSSGRRRVLGLGVSEPGRPNLTSRIHNEG